MEKTEPGKSTLIEAIAISLGLNPEGGSNNMQFSNYDDYSELYKHLTISKFGVPKTKFFYELNHFIMLQLILAIIVI